ncbi:hypothetical protein [Kamptonema sp. UHCC 0994]|uniref:hypothetical protein n=1 Tax=Kamptonema sp. UHCC 0994 TaxID=3031329 RepID=UPI0023B9C8F2|nr:hypothetical protein [Kamptonema sp. UHCC 0994]MDF0552315.1 hypothetical protein [Kamptonema sp. UHCC 0994]
MAPTKFSLFPRSAPAVHQNSAPNIQTSEQAPGTQTLLLEVANNRVSRQLYFELLSYPLLQFRKPGTKAIALKKSQIGTIDRID